MTVTEQQELVSWVAAGNSPYSNPYNLAGESGRELDFVAVARLTGELVSGLVAG